MSKRTAQSPSRDLQAVDCGGSSYAKTWEFPGEELICSRFFSLNQKVAKALRIALDDEP